MMANIKSVHIKTQVHLSYKKAKLRAKRGSDYKQDDD